MDRKASPVNREQKKIVPGKKDKLQKWRICKKENPYWRRSKQETTTGKVSRSGENSKF